MSAAMTEGFAPILGSRATVLILGTLPSQQSLRQQQYYAHPRNAFWPIMGHLFAAGPELPYDCRSRVLMQHAVAVWDVLAAGHRPGSLDAAIDERSLMANNFKELWNDHPEIQTVCFNGQKAAKLFRDFVVDQPGHSLPAIRFVTMPSTSPAHATMKFAEKLERWKGLLPPE